MKNVCRPAFKQNAVQQIMCTLVPKGGTISIVFLICFLVGCATPPFESPPEAEFLSVDSTEVVNEFDRSVTKSFDLLESVVFHFLGKKLTGLGYLSVDDAAGTYALSCMTPAGIKLFEFKGEGKQVETLFVPPVFKEQKDPFMESVARDIRRIYFDWIPSADAEITRKKNRLVFKERTENETVEYTFAGPQRTLARKRFSKGWRTVCTIDYFEYNNDGGKLHPYGIVLRNRKYHYRLVLRVKNFYPVQDDG